MNGIAWLECELTYYKYAVQRFNHYITWTSPFLLSFSYYSQFVTTLDYRQENILSSFLEGFKKFFTFDLVCWFLWPIHSCALFNAKSCLNTHTHSHAYTNTHTHTLTHIYIYIYIYVCVCVCVCVSVCVCALQVNSLNVSLFWNKLDLICLHTVKWLQVLISNTNNSI